MLPAGLRAEFEQIALEMRDELGLAPADRLSPTSLARHLAIETIPIDAFGVQHPGPVKHLVETEPNAFSAATVFFESKRLIVFNPQHSPRRHANTIAHELAHVLLEHEPAPLFDAQGQRHWDAVNEEEADYLAGALLVPRCAVVPILAAVAGDRSAAAAHFGISHNLMQARTEAAADSEPPARAEIAAQLAASEVQAVTGSIISVHRVAAARRQPRVPAPTA